MRRCVRVTAASDRFHPAERALVRIAVACCAGIATVSLAACSSDHVSKEPHSPVAPRADGRAVGRSPQLASRADRIAAHRVRRRLRSTAQAARRLSTIQAVSLADGSALRAVTRELSSLRRLARLDPRLKPLRPTLDGMSARFARLTRLRHPPPRQVAAARAGLAALLQRASALGARL
jgi:hypothetical protein